MRHLWSSPAFAELLPCAKLAALYLAHCPRSTVIAGIVKETELSVRQATGLSPVETQAALQQLIGHRWVKVDPAMGLILIDARLQQCEPATVAPAVQATKESAAEDIVMDYLRDKKKRAYLAPHTGHLCH